MTQQWRRLATVSVLLAVLVAASGCASLFSATAERLGFGPQGRLLDERPSGCSMGVPRFEPSPDRESQANVCARFHQNPHTDLTVRLLRASM